MTAAETSPRPLIAGNWKMHGLRADAVALSMEIARRARRAVAAESRCDIVVCPPATLVAAVAEAVAESPVRVGAQDCHWRESGAHTGDVSAAIEMPGGFLLYLAEEKTPEKLRVSVLTIRKRSCDEWLAQPASTK